MIAADALAAAATTAPLLGADPARATVLRVGAAVLVRLPDAGVVLRVEGADRVASAERQVAAARAMARAGVPAARLAGPDGQPWAVGDLWVTAWRWIPARPGASVDPADLGALTRLLHRLTAGVASPEVPMLDPFAAIEEQLDAADRAGATTADDLHLLRAALSETAESWAAAAADPLGSALVHGDLHAQNVIVTDDGPVLVDLELAGVGPPTYDLAAQVVALERYGTAAAAYDRFAAAYGFDLRDWEGATTRTRTYALWTTAWAVAHRGVSRANDAEADRRVAWWRDPGSVPRWTIL